MNKLTEYIIAGPLFSIMNSLNSIERKLKKMGQLQDAVDAIAQRLSGVSDQLNKGFGEVKAEIQELQDKVNAGETVDFSGLNAKVDAISSVAQAIDDIVPDPPAEGESASDGSGDDSGSAGAGSGSDDSSSGNGASAGLEGDGSDSSSDAGSVESGSDASDPSGDVAPAEPEL